MTKTNVEEDVRVPSEADDLEEAINEALSIGEISFNIIDEQDTSQAESVDEQNDQDPNHTVDVNIVVENSAPITIPRSQDENNEPDTNSLMEDSEDPSEEEESEGNDCSSLLVRLLCWPLMIPFIFIASFCFIFFFTVPLMMCLLGTTCLYYCCTRDPIAPRVLWAALWQEEFAMPHDEESGLRPFGAVYTPDQMKSMCLRRILLERIPLDNHKSIEDDDNTLVVHTTYETLIFSAPLSDDLGTKPRDEDDTAPASHYYRRQLNDSECIDLERGEKEKDSSIGISSGYSRKLHESDSTLHSAQTSPPMDESEWARGAACDICLLEYEPNDIVAWSRNPACSHAFHEDCIADWLVRKLSCPSCRQDFVRAEDILNEKKRTS